MIPMSIGYAIEAVLPAPTTRELTPRGTARQPFQTERRFISAKNFRSNKERELAHQSTQRIRVSCSAKLARRGLLMPRKRTREVKIVPRLLEVGLDSQRFFIVSYRRVVLAITAKYISQFFVSDLKVRLR